MLELLLQQQRVDPQQAITPKIINDKIYVQFHFLHASFHFPPATRTLTFGHRLERQRRRRRGAVPPRQLRATLSPAPIRQSIFAPPATATTHPGASGEKGLYIGCAKISARIRDSYFIIIIVMTTNHLFFLIELVFMGPSGTAGVVHLGYLLAVSYFIGTI